MPLVAFELTISASARLHTYALNRAATGIGGWVDVRKFFQIVMVLALLCGHQHWTLLKHHEKLDAEETHVPNSFNRLQDMHHMTIEQIKVYERN
jgi:hypothetical protein